jgi:Domain of unknown function (DUF4276)
MGKNFDVSRFVPFVVMHEFEALLFSDCAAFSSAISRPDARSRFEQIRRGLATPEEINDSPATAPSKRIIRVVPEYDKVRLGASAILEIGLPKIRQECPHFDAWITRLENLVK